MNPSNNLANKIPSDIYWKVQFLCKNILGHSSLEPPMECNQDQMPFKNQVSLWPFQPSCIFRLVLERKTGKEIPESSGVEFLEKFSSNNFALFRRKHLRVVE